LRFSIISLAEVFTYCL